MELSHVLVIFRGVVSDAVWNLWLYDFYLVILWQVVFIKLFVNVLFFFLYWSRYLWSWWKPWSFCYHALLCFSNSISLSQSGSWGWRGGELLQLRGVHFTDAVHVLLLFPLSRGNLWTSRVHLSLFFPVLFTNLCMFHHCKFFNQIVIVLDSNCLKFRLFADEFKLVDWVVLRVHWWDLEYLVVVDVVVSIFLVVECSLLVTMCWNSMLLCFFYKAKHIFVRGLVVTLPEFLV